MKNYLLISLICLYVVNCYSQNKIKHKLPSNFEDMCFKHIEELASYGIRSARLKSGSQTYNYLTQKFQEYGLETRIDTFIYTKFEYDSAVASVNGEQIQFSRIFINPYLNEPIIKSKIFTLDIPLHELKEDLSSSVAIVAESYSFFDLFEIDTKAILVVQDSIYSKVNEQYKNSCYIEMAV